MLRLLICTLVLLLAATADAKLFRVDSTDDQVDTNPGDGTCVAASGDCTLRAAVQEANALAGADVIRVPAGTYVLDKHGSHENDAASGDLDLRGKLRIVGAGVGSTIVDGDDADRVFDVRAGARVTIIKIAVRRGKAETGGLGGGVSVDGGARVRLKRVLVEASSAFGGGGIFSLAPIKLTTSTVRDNFAEVGGGLVAGGGSRINASTFNNNVATGVSSFNGHDIQTQGPGTVTVINSTIDSQIQTIAFCLPPGDCTEGADVVLANVTVNEVSRVSTGPESGSFTLRNTIVHVCNATLISQGYNFVVPEGCAIVGTLFGVVVGDDPLLSSLGDHGGPTATRVPVGVSEAVDNGNPLTPGSGGTACEPVDQRGVVRPDGIYCDIGAVEAH